MLFCNDFAILKQVQHMVQDDEVFWIAALPLVARNDWIWLYEAVLRWSDCFATAITSDAKAFGLTLTRYGFMRVFCVGQIAV